LEDAIQHHLDVAKSARNYDPRRAGVASDLQQSKAPAALLLKNVDPLVAKPLKLTDSEFADLVQFVRTGLLDPRCTPDRLLQLVPHELPSGLPLHEFTFDDD
jgi:hypothetical protein